MKAHVVIPAAILGLALVSAGASAQSGKSAKPDNPNGVGEVVSDLARNTDRPGQSASEIARAPDGRGLADYVQDGRIAAGSVPNPPGRP